jgi:ubiquinone/menaquinone biosynthesis C-methylase UbiE
MSNNREQYTMGYGQAATAIMAMRTAREHAAFFLPYLEPGMRLLDCGCGPGSITLGFAEVVAPGQALGTEIEASQVRLARENAVRRQVSNVRFEVASVYELPFDDASFDAVFISAVLGNLQEPVRGLRETHRVLKPGGVIGIKEFDHGGDIVYPLEPSLEKYGALYRRLRHEYGHDADGGRKIGVFLLEAGFSDLRRSACYETYADPNGVAGFASVSAGLLSEGWGEAFTSRGWATPEDLKEMSEAWGRFAATPGAIFAAAWCEAVARKAT